MLHSGSSISSFLYISSGLPATGKTILSQELAKCLNAVYLRIDAVEQALRDLCSINVQGEGYRLSYRVAADNLKLGMSVVADSCNPVELTRREWESVAKASDANYVNIEIICSDKYEHKRRANDRISTVDGLKLPTWTEIENREYHGWGSERIVVDTADRTERESFDELISKLHIMKALPLSVKGKR